MHPNSPERAPWKPRSQFSRHTPRPPQCRPHDGRGARLPMKRSPPTARAAETPATRSPKSSASARERLHRRRCLSRSCRQFFQTPAHHDQGHALHRYRLTHPPPTQIRPTPPPRALTATRHRHLRTPAENRQRHQGPLPRARPHNRDPRQRHPPLPHRAQGPRKSVVRRTRKKAHGKNPELRMQKGSGRNRNQTTISAPA